MASDADWVEDVRRWCLAGREVEGGYVVDSPPPPINDSRDAIGYEAALPSLQSRYWPDAPATAAKKLR